MQLNEGSILFCSQLDRKIHLRAEGMMAGIHMKQLVSLCQVRRQRDTSGGV